MSVQENLKIAKSFYEEFNKRNFSTIEKIVDEKALLHLVPFNVKFSGKEGYLQLVQSWVNAFPDGQCHVKNIIADENCAVAEFDGRGIQTGVFITPEGEIMPTGKNVDVPFCDVFEIKNGKIITYNSYFDSSTFMKQLGLVTEAKHQR